jgi:hypothetical protein
MVPGQAKMIDLVALAPLASVPHFRFPYALTKLLLIAVGVVFCARKRPIPLPVICLWSWCALSALLSSDRKLAMTGILNDWGQGLLGISIVVLTYRGATARAIGIVRSVGSAIAVLALFEVAWAKSPILGRACGPIGSPVHTGELMALLIPGASLAQLPLLLAGLAATKCRSAALAAACGFLYARRQGKVALLVLLVCLGAWWLKKAGSESDYQRLWAWRAAISEPFSLKGRGPGCFVRVWMEHGEKKAHYVHVSAHNDLLEVLTTIGLIGFSLYVWAWSWASRRLMCAELLVLFLLLKFNPLSLEIAAVAVLMIGAQVERRQDVPGYLMLRSRAGALLHRLGVFIGSPTGGSGGRER